MLVLARKIGEKIILNDNIEVIVLDSNQNTVRIGINAPKNVSVYREELYREIKTANIDSKNVSAKAMNELQDMIKKRKEVFVTTDRYKAFVSKVVKE